MQQERSTRGFSFLFRCCRSIQSSFFRHALKASFFRHAPAKPRLVAVLSFKLRFTRFQQVLTASHCLQKEAWRAWLVPLYIAFKKNSGQNGYFWAWLAPPHCLQKEAWRGRPAPHIAFKKNSRQNSYCWAWLVPHITFEKKLEQSGWYLERDTIANSKSKEIILDRCNFREDIFQRIFPDDCLEKVFEHPHIG